MSIRDIREKLTSFLRGPRPETEPNEPDAPGVPAPQQEGPVHAPADPIASPFENLTVDLDASHPIYQLHDLRRKEYGYLPQPRLVLDEEGVLPQEPLERELKRAAAFLTSVCGLRLKEINGKKKPKGGRKEPEDGPEEESAPPLDAQLCFFLSIDRLYAWVLALPPVNQGEELSREALRRALRAEDICFGVDEALADRLSHDENRYFTLHLIARGKPAFDGKNGNIVEHFPREVDRVLEVNEFNQVDYTALNLIYNVDQGEEICRLILPTEGEPGRTVRDEVIPAKGGKEVPLPKGRNTEISEDGLSLVASIAGHVEFSGGCFQVKPVLDIPGDVDFSTGDIKFLGDVNIEGDVLSGFSVRAMGNIQVKGALEAGCSVEAGGDLAVVKGILGDGETVVRCQRSLFSKYIENATIQVRENLQTDCIINGDVYCGAEVLVKSGRGTIMGGSIRAAKRIAANILGAPSECRNVVVLGGNPCDIFEKELLDQEIRNQKEELERLDSQPESRVKASLMQKAQAKLSVAEMKRRRLAEEAPPPDPYALDNGRLECGIAYAGTEIWYGNEAVRLRHETRQCVATIINNEIVML